MLKQLEELLGTHGTPHERIAHPEAFTAQEEAAAVHHSGWSWAKVVIVKARDGLAMAVLPACCTIDMNRLKGLIGRGEIELASVEDMLRAFPGCELGAIPPFGALFAVPTARASETTGEVRCPRARGAEATPGSRAPHSELPAAAWSAIPRGFSFAVWWQRGCSSMEAVIGHPGAIRGTTDAGEVTSLLNLRATGRKEFAA